MKENKKEEEQQQQNQNICIGFCRLWGELMELWKYISHNGS